MRKTRVTLLLTFPLYVASVVDSDAQQSTTRGWVLGLDFGIAAVSFEDAPSDVGGVVGARVGYGLNRVVAPYVGLYEADAKAPNLGFDDVTFGHVDFGVRLHLAGSHRWWVPYADVAVSFWPVTDVVANGKRTKTDFTGEPTLSIGGGLAMYLSESWVVDVNFKWATGRFTGVPVPNIAAGDIGWHALRNIDATSTRLTLGLSWWP